MQTRSPTKTAGSTSSIIAAIQAEIPPVTQGGRCWHERVPQEHADTIRAIHAAWHDGLFGARRITAARVISRRLRDMGIEIGTQGVVAWLRLPKS